MCCADRQELESYGRVSTRWWRRRPVEAVHVGVASSLQLRGGEGGRGHGVEAARLASGLPAPDACPDGSARDCCPDVSLRVKAGSICPE